MFQQHTEIFLPGRGAVSMVTVLKGPSTLYSAGQMRSRGLWLVPKGWLIGELATDSEGWGWGAWSLKH